MKVNYTIREGEKAWEKGDELSPDDIKKLGTKEIERLIEIGALEGKIEEVKDDEDLSLKKVPELKELATSLEITFDEKIKKADLIELILAKQEEIKQKEKEDEGE